MAVLNPYIVFNGNCEAAFIFYKSIFGREFNHIGRYKDTPPTAGSIFPPEAGEKIMHVSLPISAETVLMGCDSIEDTWSEGKQNFHLFISANDEQEANRLFKALSVQGHIEMPMSKTFWGTYFGILTDKFAIHWMISCNSMN